MDSISFPSFNALLNEREVSIFKLVRGRTSEPIAHHLTVFLVNWVDTPQEFRESFSGVFDSMYEEVRSKRGTYL